MNKILTLCVLVITLFSCENTQEKYYKSSPIKLRQLINDEEIRKSSCGSFFLIGGSYSSHEETVATIKVLGRINGLYKFIKMDMSEVRIKIDNLLKEPNIVVKYFSVDKLPLEKLTSEYCYERVYYIINCPEKYLPKKLLPIEIQL